MVPWYLLVHESCKLYARVAAESYVDLARPKTVLILKAAYQSVEG